MSPKQVDKLAARLRAAVELQLVEEPVDVRDNLLDALELAIGVAKNLAVIADQTRPLRHTVNIQQ